MNYNDLWNEYVESNKLKKKKGDMMPSFSPEVITALLNAYSPYDLYNKPSTVPPWTSYPTSAVNIDNQRGGPIGIPMLNASVGEDPKRQLSPFYNISQVQKNYPPDVNAENAVAVHENAHGQDPRLNPYAPWSFPNHGLMTYGGLSGGLLQREFPAMVAEDRWVQEQMRKKT